MPNCFLRLTFCGLEINNISRITTPCALYVRLIEIAIATCLLVLSDTLIVSRTFTHLRIIGGFSFVENANVFMLTKWLFLAFRKFVGFDFSQTILYLKSRSFDKSTLPWILP